MPQTLELHLVPLHPQTSVADWLSTMAPKAKQAPCITPNADPVNNCYMDESPPASPASSLASASVIVSDISSSAVSTLASLPTSGADLSKKARAGDDIEDGSTPFDYDNIVWSRLLGYTKPLLRPVNKLNVAMWTAGVPLERNGHRYYLCLDCHKSSAMINHLWNVERGSANVLKHLERYHSLVPNPDNKFELIQVDQRQSPAIDLDADDPHDQAILNQLAGTFNNAKFHHLVLRWMVYENISFRQIDSKPFGEMVEYLSRRGFEALPGRMGIRSMIMQSYQAWKKKVKQELTQALSKIHISFDLWTSGNCLALNGIVAHFIDRRSRSQTILLATPEQCESHAGVNIAREVLKVIKDFELEAIVGWFVLDNAQNNDTAIEEIAEKLGFNPVERRLRCAGHIINLIARHLLYGFDSDLFEECDSISANLKEELERWRRHGPVGKAHNLITWVYASPQRRARWHKCKWSTWCWSS